MNVLGQDLKDGDILGNDVVTVVDRTPMWTHIKVQRGSLTLSSVIGNDWWLNIVRRRQPEKRIVVLQGEALEWARKVCDWQGVDGVRVGIPFWDVIRDAVKE